MRTWPNCALSVPRPILQILSDFLSRLAVLVSWKIQDSSHDFDVLQKTIETYVLTFLSLMLLSLTVVPTSRLVLHFYTLSSLLNEFSGINE